MESERTIIFCYIHVLKKNWVNRMEIDYLQSRRPIKQQENRYIQWDCRIYWFYGIILGEIWALPIGLSGGYWCGSLNNESNHLKPVLYGCVRKKLIWATKDFTGHSDSKIWGLLSKASVLKPIRPFSL